MVNLNEALEVAVNAAKLAGERIKEGQTEDYSIEVKGDIADRVTQIDLDAQKIIRDSISAKFSDHDFMEEEADAKQEQTSKYRWIIDPLDGTSNFIQGFPHVGVSIALEFQGEPVLGVLYFPFFDDLYTGIKGEGAFLNGKEIHVRPCDDMKKAFISEIYSDRIHRGKPTHYPPSLAYRKYGSAVTSLAYLADGRLQGMSLICNRWDMAAAEVIIKEAGGKITFELHDPENERGPGTCIASSPGIYDELKKIVEAEYSKNS